MGGAEEVEEERGGGAWRLQGRTMIHVPATLAAGSVVRLSVAGVTNPAAEGD